MKILLISDHEESGLYDYYNPEKTEGVDLIISCGDLHPEYMTFVMDAVNRPLVYVRGNHDGRYNQEHYAGCIDIDDRVYDFHGLRILGLGGSMRYGVGGDMYTEEEMEKRIRKIDRTIRLMNGFDILVTHAPAKGYGDMEDLPHRGFACFNGLLEKYRPKFMFYGHVHRTYGFFEKEYLHPSGTRLINGYGWQIVNIGDCHPEYGKTGSTLYDLYISMKERRNRH